MAEEVFDEDLDDVADRLGEAIQASADGFRVLMQSRTVRKCVRTRPCSGVMSIV